MKAILWREHLQDELEAAEEAEANMVGDVVDRLASNTLEARPATPQPPRVGDYVRNSVGHSAEDDDALEVMRASLLRSDELEAAARSALPPGGEQKPARGGGASSAKLDAAAAVLHECARERHSWREGMGVMANQPADSYYEPDGLPPAAGPLKLRPWEMAWEEHAWQLPARLQLI